MANIEQVVLSLVKSAIDGGRAEIPDDIDWEAIWKIGKVYKLLPLIYAGLGNSGISVPEELSVKFDKAAIDNLMYDQRQQHVLSKLQKAFDENGIEYMPVKGIILKTLYPTTDLRPMGDGDILINLSQKAEVDRIMADRGYTFTCESAHELIFNKNGVCIELHKHLIPPYNKDYHSYYGNGWKLAKIESGTRYKLSDEDHYIYLFTHFAKHYRDGGVGPLHLVDLWVFERATTLNTEYILAELEKLQLKEFFTNIRAVIDAWFNGGEYTDIVSFITARVFNNGAWGTSQSKTMAAAVKVSKSSSMENIGFAKTVKTIFPSAETMQYKYPILKKHKFMLPACWLHRIFKTVFFKKGRIKQRIEESKLTNAENVSAYQDELNYVGLDFNFKE